MTLSKLNIAIIAQALIKPRLHALLITLSLVWCLPVASQIFLGGPCTFGGYSNVRGQCKHLPDCPSAISNFRAGINPSLCYQRDDVSVICCQSEKRISEIKCEEYSKKISELQTKKDTSFAPLIAGGNEGASYNHSRDKDKCNDVDFSVFIVGGRSAKENELSFTVALGYVSGGAEPSWFCGGTLISDQFILTAAHCLDGKKSNPPNIVLLGDKNLKKLDSFTSQYREEVRVKEIFVHPEYERPNKYNDIGLIKLEKKVNFSRTLWPACLPQPNSRPETVKNFLVAGWGQLGYFGARGENLQVVNIGKMDTSQCSDAFGTASGVPRGILRSQICAGDKEGGNKDSCGGDSGGPLVSYLDRSTCIQTILGVVSFGDRFCGNGRPAVYTNVQSYLDWIESITWETEFNDDVAKF